MAANSFNNTFASGMPVNFGPGGQHNLFNVASTTPCGRRAQQHQHLQTASCSSQLHQGYGNLPQFQPQRQLKAQPTFRPRQPKTCTQPQNTATPIATCSVQPSDSTSHLHYHKFSPSVHQCICDRGFLKWCGPNPCPGTAAAEALSFLIEQGRHTVNIDSAVADAEFPPQHITAERILQPVITLVEPEQGLNESDWKEFIDLTEFKDNSQDEVNDSQKVPASLEQNSIEDNAGTAVVSDYQVKDTPAVDNAVIATDEPKPMSDPLQRKKKRTPTWLLENSEGISPCVLSSQMSKDMEEHKKEKLQKNVGWTRRSS